MTCEGRREGFGTRLDGGQAAHLGEPITVGADAGSKHRYAEGLHFRKHVAEGFGQQRRQQGEVGIKALDQSRQGLGRVAFDGFAAGLCGVIAGFRAPAGEAPGDARRCDR